VTNKLTFRPRRPAQLHPRYPTWASSRRDFLRALGGAAAGGVLGTLAGCEDERAVPPPPDSGHINDTFGMPDSPRTPRDMGTDQEVPGPDFKGADRMGVPPDIPAPLDQAPADITPPPDFSGGMPDMPTPKDLQLEGCIVSPDHTSGTPDAPVTPKDIWTPKDLWPHPSDTAGLPPPPDVPWPPPKDGGGQ